MSNLDNELNKAIEEATKSARELGEAQTVYEIKRMHHDQKMEAVHRILQEGEGHPTPETNVNITGNLSTSSGEDESIKEEEEKPKSDPVDEGKTKSNTKPSNKGTEGPPPPAPKKEEQEQEEPEDEDQPEHSSEVKARTAKNVIRTLADQPNPEETIQKFIGNGEESRKTVFDVAATQIGEELIAPYREGSTYGEDEDAPEDTKQEPEKPTPPKPKPTKPSAPSKPKKPSKPAPPPASKKKEEKADAKDEEEKTEEAIDEVTDGTGDLRVELPDGVTRPEGCPECFGNADVYDPDSEKCMMCIFDFECEEAQEAIANQD